MAKLRKCEICGKEFEPLATNQRYCCLVCSRAAQKIRRQEWNDQNPSYYREYHKQQIRKKADCELNQVTSGVLLSRS